jgi:pyridoxamine 5'-phosphate oxidase
MERDPVKRFKDAMARAEAAGVELANAVSLATADADGRPSVRMVLLKEADTAGFVFYTNMESRKAVELAVNPHAALCFHWQAIEEQIRIEGPVVQVSDREADEYFATRPRGSQLGAWASNQSHPLPSRQALLQAFEEAGKRFENRDVPRPPRWSGFRLRAERIEFWRARPERLHERHLYKRRGEEWDVTILAP